MSTTVKVTVELEPVTALALAQFVKRVSWGELRANAATNQEAYDMQDAMCKVQSALGEVGFAPR